MRFVTLGLMTAAGLSLAACKSDPPCTPQELDSKIGQLMDNMMSVVFSDPAKAEKLQRKMQEIAMREFSDEPSLAETCAAVDDLIKELG